MSTYDDFERLFPGLAEKIFEQFYGDADHGFDIYDKQSLDREGCNFSFSAELVYNNILINVDCQDGNWNGSEIILFEHQKILLQSLSDSPQYGDKCKNCGGGLTAIIGNFTVCEKCHK